MCEQTKKGVEGNSTVQKLAPLCVSSYTASSRFLGTVHSGLTDQQTGKASPPFSPPPHLPYLASSHYHGECLHSSFPEELRLMGMLKMEIQDTTR